MSPREREGRDHRKDIHSGSADLSSRTEQTEYVSPGRGGTKKKAEQLAAKQACWSISGARLRRMSDQDQSPKKVWNLSRRRFEAVPAVSRGPSQSTEPQARAPNTVSTAATVAPEHKAHRAPADMFGAQAFLTVVIFSIFVITFIVPGLSESIRIEENTLLIGIFWLVEKLHFAGKPGASHLLPYGTIKRT